MQLLDERVYVGQYQRTVDSALEEMAANRVVRRIWERDHTLWKPEPTEIANRLGWLDIASRLLPEADRLASFAEAVRSAGYTHALLLGMGGSSLAPEVFREVLDVSSGHPSLDVLDSTVPGSVLAYEQALDPAQTLFIVSTKSGTTIETLSFFKTFYNHTLEALGNEEAGRHFAAVTDAGTRLDKLAGEHGFRETFLNDPDIGGRYSALSYVGLVPAALIGADLKQLLSRGIEMEDACKDEVNPAARLGTIMGKLAQVGRDKLTLVLSPPLSSLGDWIEQLIAESTGKEGTGILPVVGERLAAPDVYGDDRLFVYLRLAGDSTFDNAVAALETAGQPVVRYGLRDPYDIGAQMFMWEFATAVASHHLGINPFDQPNVESAKKHAREMMDAAIQQGRLPAQEPSFTDGPITVYGDVSASSAPEALLSFVSRRQPDAYISLQAYLQPSEPVTETLRELQTRLRDRTRLATTLGYGPRFLHSTGQLHKGDAGKGLFIQFTADDPTDVPIPDEAGIAASSMTFGILKEAQVLGDERTLRDAGRRVIRFGLGADVEGGLRRLVDALG